MLTLGSQGTAVLNLQKNLIALLILPLDADGVFGPQTLSAVKNFQASHGLQVDGQVGPATQSAITAALVAKLPAVPGTEMPWMSWMEGHIGEAFKTGSKPTAFDEEVFSHTSYGNLDGVMQPGCAATACAALEETGFASPHDARAISFAKYGIPCELQPGCAVVYQWANGEHHVDFCHHIIDGSTVAGIGGNQNHSLNISTYSRKYIIATRWPVKPVKKLTEQLAEQLTPAVAVIDAPAPAKKVSKK